MAVFVSYSPANKRSQFYHEKRLSYPKTKLKKEMGAAPLLRLLHQFAVMSWIATGSAQAHLIALSVNMDYIVF